MVYLPLLPQRFGGGIVLSRHRYDRNARALGRLGSLEVRLARSVEEIRRAQRLRYRVFYEERSAVANVRTTFSGRDRDAYDRFCDHLLVLDHASGEPEIVGTYRLLRQEAAAKRGFYSAGEFDVEGLIARHPDRVFLEIGRSCVLKPYRSKRTVELLWHGLWSYVRGYGIDAIFGCASLEGTDLNQLAPQLALLHQIAPAPGTWQVSALPGRSIPIERLDAPANGAAALRALPPLIKGYLRLGAYVCGEAVIDRQFGTTDVFMLLPFERISERYINYYGPDGSRHAA